ncbi:phytanoyl-CoA dioxygenase family protein [Pseudanabaena sp. BC1403]|uniref:phytanoyl-CoA dioxygenase family protein n=1 Tax=Pseudanabaena sp. BC1403 TaxID=2043171 RepID=UPI000CD88781|nr:phytanoyl-CoA dioxygenase family protein [Pseudanabaena sp. BC1403]
MLKTKLNPKTFLPKIKSIFFKIQRYQMYVAKNKHLVGTISESLLNVLHELNNIHQSSIEDVKKQELLYVLFKNSFPKVLWNWATEQKVKSISIRFYDNVIAFVEGYEQYCNTGMTSPEANHSSRQLYWMTDGKFNNFWVSFYGLFFPKYPKYLFSDQARNLGLTESRGLQNIVQEIRDKGYHLFDEKLSREICDRLTKFAENALCKLAPHYPDISTEKYLRYDSDNPKSVTYRVDEQELANNPDIQNLIADSSIISVVQEYFGCRATLRDLSMWWSTAFLKGDADSSSAQLYHWDGDSVKFINVFIYLTEVTSQNGPHCFVRGSHLTKPLSLLRDGRFSDQEIENFYGKEHMDEIVGKRGTIIAADTRAFHKGKALEHSERLIIMLTFSMDLFGATYSSIQLSDGLTDALSQSMKHFPYSYSKFRVGK